MRIRSLRLSVLIVALLAGAALGPGALSQTPSVSAQGSNLLQSPQFSASGWYQKDGVDGQIPGGWDVWANGQPPASDYNQFLPYTRSAPGSWEMRGGYVAWSGGALQNVNGVTVGATYRFTIYAFAWTCNDIEFSCTDAEGRSSDTSFNSQIRVGIDPTGGTNPTAATVLWSGWGTSYDQFAAFSVDAIAEAGAITVFTQNSVSQPPPALRQVFWDDASLVQLGEGNGNPLNSGVSTGGDGDEGGVDVVAPPQTVPFVTPQAAQPDGSVVHTVLEGDTVNSIYIGYRYLGITRESFYALNGWEEPPRFITVGEQILILPAGSVDPTTGQLLTTGSGTTSVPGTTTETTDTTDTTTGIGTDTGTGTGTGTAGVGTGTNPGVGTDTDTGTGAPSTGNAPDPNIPSTIVKGG